MKVKFAAAICFLTLIAIPSSQGQGRDPNIPEHARLGTLRTSEEWMKFRHQEIEMQKWFDNEILLPIKQKPDFIELQSILARENKRAVVMFDVKQDGKIEQIEIVSATADRDSTIEQLVLTLVKSVNPKKNPPNSLAEGKGKISFNFANYDQQLHMSGRISPKN